MSATINCNKCGNLIEVSEALSKELETRILKDLEGKHEKEIANLIEKQKLTEQQNLREIENVKAQIDESLKKEAYEKVRREYDAKYISAKEEADERGKQNKELLDQVSNLMKQLRESKDAEGKFKLHYEKQLLEEQERIKLDAKKSADDESRLVIAQKDKQLTDLSERLKEAQRKAEQGSQQLQGEVQETMLEDQLRSTFIYDEIAEVPKGINGADVIQKVNSNFGITSGSIVWESKNTKAWSQQWISKLKEDTRALKADISVIVTSVLPEGVESFGQVDGIWVCDFKSAIPLAYALRERLIAVHNIKEANQGKSTKAEVVYNYLISNDFKQRIEVWVEYFNSRKEELETEKRYFMKKWEKEDKNIMRVIQNTAGMYGDLQGFIGNALPKVHSFELPEGEK